MKTRRFFAVLWRVNAVLILCVSLLAGIALSIMLYMLLKQATRKPHVDDVASAAMGEIEDQNAALGYFEKVTEGGVLRAPLSVEEADYSLGSGSYEAGAIRNYLFFDPTSRSTHWLKPSMEGRILVTTSLPEREYDQKMSDTSVIVYVVVEEDSNGDRRLTDADTKQIALSDPQGKNYRVVVEKADDMKRALLLSTDRLLILYSIGPELTAVELNPQHANAPLETYELQTGAG